MLGLRFNHSNTLIIIKIWIKNWQGSPCSLSKYAVFDKFQQGKELCKVFDWRLVTSTWGDFFEKVPFFFNIRQRLLSQNQFVVIKYGKCRRSSIGAASLRAIFSLTFSPIITWPKQLLPDREWRRKFPGKEFVSRLFWWPSIEYAFNVMPTNYFIINRVPPAKTPIFA